MSSRRRSGQNAVNMFLFPRRKQTTRRRDDIDVRLFIRRRGTKIKNKLRDDRFLETVYFVRGTPTTSHSH